MYIGVSHISPDDLPDVDVDNYVICGGKTGPFGGGEFIYINCTQQPLYGRYVIVQGVDMNNPLHVCEVEVYTSMCNTLIHT